jgi:pSer/pThr/pTyr-binding forkhead associated (FHA) protein
MDPNWETCSYCEAEQRSNQRSDASDRQRTMVGSPRPGPSETQRATRAMGSVAPEGGHVGAGDTRRITGVLVTYTWRPEGEVFPVREGKNFIGSGEVSSEAFHRSCDIQVPHDNTMSSEHALILCRQGNYEILDQISSNGTFLGSQMLKANQGTELPNYAEIRTGSTLWTFIMVKAPAGETAPPPSRPVPTVTSPRDEETKVR